ncbi:adenylosuccinate synthetase [Streptomyces sp. CRN 30]|uniref:adenylosuccinate synthetase n=1 Tax=Streptomyces sp. CRN 30 TaxID=3075613 RepID=UPI002A82DCCE|nr:adenylosuccinate synthetase [Streptomyces sp. CRN 30]
MPENPDPAPAAPSSAEDRAGRGTGADPRAVWPAVVAARRARRQALLAPLTEGAGPPPARQHITWVGDLQQGDGGKGAMTDRLAAFHQVTARVQGGDNAGHTTVFREADGDVRTVKNHLLPSGVRHPGVVGVVANGVLVNAETLAREITELSEIAPDLRRRLVLSDRAHLVLPSHREVDGRQESERDSSGDGIGTTRRGIGPANVSKANRMGIRVADLRDPVLLRRRLRQNARFFGLPSDRAERDLAWLSRYTGLLLSLAGDSVTLLRSAVEAGYSVVLEGAQGPMLDVEHGVYPYVTTSPTAFYSVTSGSGLDGSLVGHRVGVLKAYQTMVGNGPFVTEDREGLGDRLRRAGEEFGTTTGRSRRCGWLDLTHARWAVSLNRYTSVVVTKLDVLDGFDRIGVCVSYAAPDGGHREFLPDNGHLARCSPVYCWLPGWRSPTRGLSRYEDLPVQARDFLSYVSDYLGVEVAAAGVGPAQREMLVRPGSRLAAVMAHPGVVPPARDGGARPARPGPAHPGTGSGARDTGVPPPSAPRTPPA